LKQFQEAGIEVRPYEFTPPVYHQLFGGFEANLSILDLILNEGEKSQKILAQPKIGVIPQVEFRPFI
jgi:hypothetical protein